MGVLGFGASVAVVLSNAASGRPPWQPRQSQPGPRASLSAPRDGARASLAAGSSTQELEGLDEGTPRAGQVPPVWGWSRPPA